MTLSPTQRKAALEAYAKENFLSEEGIQWALNTPGHKIHDWLRSWELATEAAYEESASVCDGLQHEVAEFSDVDGRPILCDPSDCAEAIRALAKETSGSDKDPQASDEGDQP